MELTTEEAPVLLRFSNPWNVDPSQRRALAEMDHQQLASRLRPAGSIHNHESEPVLVILFAQLPVGFPNESVRLDEIGRDFTLETASTSVRLGGEERPLWVTAVVPPGGSIALDALAVLDPVEVSRILIDGVVQLGVVVAAREGPLDVEVRDLSPLGKRAPDPAERGLLFPHHIHLTGQHNVPADRFSPSGCSEHSKEEER